MVSFGIGWEEKWVRLVNGFGGDWGNGVWLAGGLGAEREEYDFERLNSPSYMISDGSK